MLDTRIRLAGNVARATANLLEAWDEEKNARGDDPGYDWGYYGQTYFDRIAKCEEGLADALDAYAEDYTRRVAT